LNTKTIYRIFLIIIFLYVFVSFSRSLGSVFRPPFEAVEICNTVYDGDTFETSSGNIIRLADVNTPELGESGSYEAWSYLSGRILGETVYLDIDNIHIYDTLGYRIVCVLYVEVDSGKYLNINKALLDKNLARIWDHDNEFNPDSWSRYVYDLSNNQRTFIVGFSFFSTIIVVYVVNVVKNRSLKMYNRLRNR
jgi:hypothetical protein